MTNLEAVKRLETLIDFSDGLDIRALKMAIKALEQARWIPVSERLPEKHDCYLVTTKWEGSYSGDIYTETNMAEYREKLEEWDSVGVIAWMPLPEPYEEGAIVNENRKDSL